MVGEQGEDIVVLTEHVLDEAVQSALRTHLNEHPGAGVVEGVQALDELHRRGHLPAE